MANNRILEHIADHLDKIMTLTENFIYPYKGFDPRKLYSNNYSYGRASQRLIDKNLVLKKDNKFYLTLQGKLEILKNQRLKISKKNFKLSRWDGKWRLLAFDIPEKNRRTRDKLREYLFILGFKPIQKSVWITPLKIKYQDFIPLFDKKIKEKLLFIEIRKISEEKQLKRLFEVYVDFKN